MHSLTQSLTHSTVYFQFDLFANTIEDVSKIQYKALFDSTQGLSNTITAEAIALNMTFPFVTLNNFEVYARDARIASKAELLSCSLVVEATDIPAFNQYAPPAAAAWILTSEQLMAYYDSEGHGSMDMTPSNGSGGDDMKNMAPKTQILPFVYDTTYNITTGEQAITPSSTDSEVLWQTSPLVGNGFLLMSNLLSIQAGLVPGMDSPFVTVQKTKRTYIKSCACGNTGGHAEPTLFEPTVENALWVDAVLGVEVHRNAHAELHELVDDGSSHSDANMDHLQIHQPHGMLLVPIVDSFDTSQARHVGTVTALFSLDSFLINLLPQGVNGVFLVVKNTCGVDHTYRIDGNDVSGRLASRTLVATATSAHATFIGVGDLSDPDYHDMKRLISFDEYYENLELQQNTMGACLYTYQISPSGTFADTFRSNLPIVFAFVVATIFVVMAFTFFIYDVFVSRRNAKVMTAAIRSTAIVSELFPSSVRDRIYAPVDAATGVGSSSAKLRRFMDKSGKFEDQNDEGDSDAIVLESKPIADLFPETTVMFCDIAGFTAWSSVREPSQVFTLLETVYRAFDRMAKHRHVFKVETVGDCYVAVAGCPNPMKNHAVVISRFALECIQTMDTLTKQLEVTLGPDTGDLAVRIGVHSGPVTAGVLRGERARFQLFGDTMNTAARMESTGERGRIQVSEETAQLLVAAGKKHWLLQRADIVHAKGKGALKTFWLVDEKQSSDTRSNDATSTEEHTNEASNSSAHSGAHMKESAGILGLDSKTERLINWNVDVMWRLLKKVVARRISHGQADLRVPRSEEEEMENHSGSVLSEVKEIISLPEYDANAHKNEPDPDTIHMSDVVKKELEDYVASIASMYRFNPFHSFEHASHVTMSVVKLLSRIVAPTDEVNEDNMASLMHDHTYGITSDPLTQFACVLSALIHDADHPGVPNAQLVAEQNHLAQFYNNQSVAEQNSVDLAWNLLMDGSFDNLRGAIYGTKPEMKRFRQLVVNSVMATDIVDKELKSLRNARWETAFSEAAAKEDNKRDAINRKATIVIEHLIQASDVAHTMQHWHIYRKWNERFFHECYAAYKSGRAKSNPADSWYQGELGFFDFYIIPLAKKLKECGVFGVSSDEYLNYAQKNRQEWEMRGKEIVASMIEEVTRDE
eukprot:scaffold1221_cov207-Amphora_coffeaeformis.AAC.47